MENKDKLFVFEEDTDQYKQMLLDRAGETEEFSSALGHDITTLDRDETSSVACFNIERNKYFHHKKKINMYSQNSMRAMEQKVNEQLRGNIYDNLEMDLFNALYKDTPIIHANERMKEPFDVINKMVRDIVNNPEIEEIKRRTTMDPMQSLLAQEKIYENILVRYDMELDKQQEKLENNNKIEDIENLIKSIEDMPGSEDRVNELKQDLEKLNDIKNNLDENTKQDSQLLNGASSSINYDKLNDDLDNAEKLMNSFGVNDGENMKMSDIDKRDVANLLRLMQNRHMLKYLLETLGAMKDTAIAITKKNISKFGFIPTDVKIGNNIPKLVQSEKLMLANDVTKSQFYKKYSEKQLLEYETQDIQSRGPIIVCRDISGSMHGIANTWAAAIALSVLQSAKLQNRDVYIINYNTRVKSETEFKKGSKELLSKSIQISLVSADGGTEFTDVVKRVLEILNKSRYKKASVLMLTDGDGGLADRVYMDCKRIYKEKDVDMRMIFLGNPYCNSESLKRLKELSTSSFIIENNQLSDFKSYEKIAENIFDTISK